MVNDQKEEKVMKKEYQTPEAEVMEFDYEENVVASTSYEYGANDITCMRETSNTTQGTCNVIN